ncbi:MAG: hypothetical protein JST87_08220 [Bacteroidetes bacterium]|nr:hypothetical protein [Bacteroidota bacterium]
MKSIIQIGGVIIFMGIIISFTISCSQRSSIDTSLTQINNALKLAETNGQELINVIEHYKNEPLKLKAAIFLINNMGEKGFYKFELIDKNEKKVDFEPFTVDYSHIKKFIEDYEIRIRGLLFYVNKGFRLDIKTISSATIIENIDYAFEAWKLPWSKNLNFNEFCELVLPYRIENEPLQLWRKKCYEDNITWVKEKMKSSSDLLNLCTIINDSLKKAYSYRHKEMSFFPGALNFTQVSKFHGGRCADLNMVAAYIMRAVGVPIASEFTPYWANSNYGGHSWLSLFYHNKFIPFNSAYDNPIEDSLPFKGAHLAKAYRRKFDKQNNRGADSIYNERLLSSDLEDFEVVDITSEYLNTSNVSIDITNTPAKLNYAFLGVLNGKAWKIIQSAEIQNGKANFKAMATDVLYAPLYSTNKTIIPVSDCFLLNADGTKQFFVPYSDHKIEMTFDTKRINWIAQGATCHIVYWNGLNWIDAGSSLKYDSNKKNISFRNLPANSIYRIVNDSSINANESNYGRPFLYNKKKKKNIDY